MKKKFSKYWKASKQPRKQRKYIANAPLHIRRKMMTANLSKDLRKKHGKRSLPVRVGDAVKIMRGKFKKKAGKINKVDLKKLRVSIEGIQRQKKDGTKVNVYFSPSKIQIQELNLDDTKRMQIKPAEKPAEKKSETAKTKEKNVSEKK